MGHVVSKHLLLRDGQPFGGLPLRRVSQIVGPEVRDAMRPICRQLGDTGRIATPILAKCERIYRDYRLTR